MLSKSVRPKLYVTLKGGRFRVYNREQNSEEYYDTLEGYLESVWLSHRDIGKITIPEWRFLFSSFDDKGAMIDIVLGGMQDNYVVEDIIMKLATYCDWRGAEGALRPSVYIRLYDKRLDNGKKVTKSYVKVNGESVRSRYVGQLPPEDWEKAFGLDWVVIPEHTWVDSAYSRVKIPNKERIEAIAQLVQRINNSIKQQSVPF